MGVEIVFETHSISVDNERGIATGWLQGCLSETGKRLAQELGERRRAEGADAVFTSDLRRAVDTAEIAFAGSGIPIHRDWRLRECNYGTLNGMPVATLEAERSRHIDDPFPGGESYRQVIERVREFLDDLSRGWDGKRVAVNRARRHALRAGPPARRSLSRRRRYRPVSLAAWMALHPALSPANASAAARAAGS